MSKIHGALILARYSTDNQNPDTIEVQVTKCREWCEAHNLPILGIFADEAVSGMKDTRPEYERMMMQLRQGLADTVVIYDQSRMFRKMTAWFAFRDEISALGASVVSVTQPMIGKDLRDPTNFLTEGSMALFNQIWALQSRQKTMEKMRHMAKTGQHTGGKPALGYKVQDGRLAICEEEATVVRRIFREYASGKSYAAIIADLNRDGLKTKRGNAFGSNSLHDLLHNEKYIGVLTYGQSPYREDGTRNTHSKDGQNAIRVENAIPAIIDRETFDAVQERMQQNKRQQGGRPPTKREYPLKGKVFCAGCKSAMTISTSQKIYDYYRCTGKKRLHQCEAAPIGAEYLENKVAEAVRMVLGQPEEVNGLIRILRDQAESHQAAAVARLQELVKRDRDVAQKLNNAVEAVLSGLSSQTVRDRIRELEQQQAEIQRDLKALKASVDKTSIPEHRLRELLGQVVQTAGQDNSLILSIVYRVEVGPETLTIWTILDADPNGNIDHTGDGVTITPGVPSGVPMVFVTPGFIKIVVAR
jgi:site-specific DNA recombinase